MVILWKCRIDGPHNERAWCPVRHICSFALCCSSGSRGETAGFSEPPSLLGSGNGDCLGSIRQVVFRLLLR